MSATSHVFLRCTLALATALVFTTTASAQSLPVNATDLGQTHPRAADLSINSNFHVYTFQLNGVRYIQVNDLQNTVRAVFAYAGGQFLTLPAGVDSSRVSTPQQPRSSNSATSGEIVYQDAQVQVALAPQSSGAIWLVTPVAQTKTATLPSSSPLRADTCDKLTCGGTVVQPVGNTDSTQQ